MCLIFLLFSTQVISQVAGLTVTLTCITFTLFVNSPNYFILSNLFDKLRIHAEKEDHDQIIATIDAGVVFRGTNLWVLIFAIFVASLGLNVNSTAVIIGAMLISPLMGPIMGIGLAMGINDVLLLKKSLNNYLIATIVALVTSTIFFLVSPLDDAHSEILARTSPTIYDVLIALFGGFAGIVATASKQKGNVIPGVAIATALMPPLCTAGYGLATLKFNFFFGAFYLFMINTVFIALATFLISRLLHFPYKQLHNERSEKMAKGIVWMVVLITLIPSLYLGYDLVQKDRFIKNANNFITNEAKFPNDYLLNKKIDAKTKTISLVFGGKEIDSTEIAAIKNKLPAYKLDNATLEIKQGFAYLADKENTTDNEREQQLATAIEQQASYNKRIQQTLDSINNIKKTGSQLYAELKAQYPTIKNAVIEPATIFTDSAKSKQTFLVSLLLSRPLSGADKTKMINWLKVRLNSNELQLITQL